MGEGKEIKVWWVLLLSALNLKVSLSREERRNIANMQVKLKKLNCSHYSFMNEYRRIFSVFPLFQFKTCYNICFRPFPHSLTWFSMEFGGTKKAFYDEVI